MLVAAGQARILSSRTLFTLLFVHMFCGAALFGPTVHAAVGRTSGTFAVTSSGAAGYTIPIWAPPGPHGVQPHIALTYNSQRGPGYVGVGWRVTGLSAIYRCNATYAQDPAPASIGLTTSDGFCMDGQRLRLTSGTYGVAGSTYQAEATNFVNVTAYSSQGNGPYYFVAQDRSGVSYTYGSPGNEVLAPGTATALSWQLNQVKDPAGNTMTITYDVSNGTAVPNLISWTPSTYGSTTSYQSTMLFNYGARELTQNASAKYVAGSFITNAQLLASITIGVGGSFVKQYVLGYQTSPTTGRDELISIKECADSANQNCLSPTAITYQNGQAGVGAAGPTAPSPSANLIYDFNGDGRPDAVYSNGTNLYVALNTGSGFATPINTGIPATSTVTYGNVLGTGSDGILAQNGTTLYYYAYSASTNSFSSANTGASVASGSQFLLVDITGDGLPDLVVTKSNSLGVTTIPNLCSNVPNPCSGGVPSFGSAYSFTLPITIQNFYSDAYSNGSTNSGEALRALDFNGDGRQDLGIEVIGRHSSGGEIVINTFWYELISQGANAPFQVVQLPFNSQSNPPAVFGSFNDDPCTDAALGSTVYYSACNGSVATTVTLSGSPNIIAAMDWDGDGRTDLIIGAPGSTASWLQSTGTGFSATQATSFTIPSGCSAVQFYVVDIDGDGLDDLACTNASSTSSFLHNQAGHPPDLMSEILDGYGNYVKPTYVSLTQSVNSTYFEWNDAQYPYENFNGSAYLVNQAVFSDPTSTSGGTYYQNYYYAGLWLNLQGRGLMPLGDVQTYDSRNGVWDTVAYQRAFPYTGLLASKSRTSNNSSSGQLLWIATTPAETLISNTSYQQIYFPYLSNETVQNYELGSPSTRLVSTTSTSYSYDNYGNTRTITKTVTDNDTGDPLYDTQSWTTTITNTPDPNTSTWCLNLLTQTQVVYTASNGSTPVTRTKQFTPDLTNCRYSEIVTEPSSGTYRVTEDLGYDSFGNINSDKVTGAGMAARTTSTTWSNSTYTTGQFPLSVTDASGATTQLAYNYSFGVPSSITDPNGETTSWLYGDGFGRKTKETRPDGTSTQWTYNDCSASGACLIGTHTANVQFTVFKADSSCHRSA